MCGPLCKGKRFVVTREAFKQAHPLAFEASQALYRRLMKGDLQLSQSSEPAAFYQARARQMAAVPPEARDLRFWLGSLALEFSLAAVSEPGDPNDRQVELQQTAALAHQIRSATTDPGVCASIYQTLRSIDELSARSAT